MLPPISFKQINFVLAGFQVADGVKLNIRFPIEIINGKWLLYLVSTSVKTGGSLIVGECADIYANPLQYKLPLGSSRHKRQVKVERLCTEGKDVNTMQ